MSSHRFMNLVVTVSAPLTILLRGTNRDIQTDTVCIHRLKKFLGRFRMSNLRCWRGSVRRIQRLEIDVGGNIFVSDQ